jgi:hypothetical protein
VERGGRGREGGREGEGRGEGGGNIYGPGSALEYIPAIPRYGGGDSTPSPERGRGFWTVTHGQVLLIEYSCILYNKDSNGCLLCKGAFFRQNFAARLEKICLALFVAKMKRSNVRS